eukprot:NODE_386_length_2011_cov_64.280786_g379_i0.p1 GENE.NODE_386_length_2011_cov_64.280786_g379_i0~~NODE_386_length_2011_cov_64.280786_g379_i0.p1  ORF type:complete len:535 (-),score=130.63 NODE_386_length_2011_cov_64.280786_g379_i0:226-1830(-)
MAVPNVKQTNYQYQTTVVDKQSDGSYAAKPKAIDLTFQTNMRVPRTGLLLVGLGGNNGSTVVAGILTNKHKMEWETREGPQTANYLGSVTQASTIRLGATEDGEEIYVPLNTMLPMVKPDELVIGGWDISSATLAQSMQRARVLEPDLRRQLTPEMEKMTPMPSIYYPTFVAANQKTRADHILPGDCACEDHLTKIRADIQQFKKENDLEKVIVLWTANTERFCEVKEGTHDTPDNLLAGIKAGDSEIAPSQMFAVASILEGCAFINGSPQNTFVPAILAMAEEAGVFVGGDDFKSGQTKMKSVLVDFLISAGIKPTSIVSYNHLGNNDGKNLQAPQTFRSKEISKSDVVDDMVASNPGMYKPGEKPDHVVVIKYVPTVGDSKRAMDEYTSEIFLGGRSTISIHNVCEDSLLAAPLIIDLVVLTELFQRVVAKPLRAPASDFAPMHSVLSVLSYLLKAPQVSPGAPVVNALFRQRQCIENIFRALCGLPPDNMMMLEHKFTALDWTQLHSCESLTGSSECDQSPDDRTASDPDC